MRSNCKNSGFSLSEVLFAVGTLAIGMIFIAGAFPAGIHLTTIATEQTIAAVALDEAYAKIKLCAATDPNWPSAMQSDGCVEFGETVTIDDGEFAYPSTYADISTKRYFWSALCRPTASDFASPLQVTVFICRRTAGSGPRYPKDNAGVGVYDWPRPVKVGVVYADQVPPIHKNTLRILARADADASGDLRLITEGTRVIDSSWGRYYRVVERDLVSGEIVLDGDVDDPYILWVVPRPVGGGRNPCIAVYQTTVQF